MTHPNVLQFSKNVVQINVQDPEATDLSFVGLTVKGLVECYVMGKDTLIVIAMPMTGQSLELISACL